jgi:hypothetical protein
MLDLIEHVAANAAARILIVCLARGDLLERRSGWAAAGGRGSIIRLEPLSDTDSARLLGRLATRRHAKVRREEVMYAAEGNPLFLEQLVAMRADDAGVRTPRRSRRCSRRASTRSRFRTAGHRGRLDRGARISPRGRAGASWTRRGCRRRARRTGGSRADPPRPVGASGETGFRFTHILVRDAAYDLLPKRRRADLHVAYAEWLGRVDRVGALPTRWWGYHLEQAYEYRSPQLGPHR